MIKKIRIENYRGISNSKEISFLANPKRKSNKLGITKIMKKEILLSNSLMGRNASGKTSFIEGINFIEELVRGKVYKNKFHHLEFLKKWRQKENFMEKIKINFKSVMNSILKNEFNNTSKPMEFFIEFIDSKNVIGLYLELSIDGMVKEIITKNNKLFSNQKKSIENFNSNIFEKNLNFKIIEFLSIDSFDETFFLNNNKNFKNKKINKDSFLDWIRLSDIKIQKIIWKSNNQIKNFVIKHKHKNKYIEKTISISQLSSGTKKWLSISSKLFYALYVKQCFIFIDEIDCSFHPFFPRFLINLVNDLKINKKRSQIFFTSHLPSIVDIPFRKDAINYIDWNGEIINLGKLKIREDLSISKNFLSEKLGSHPNKTDFFNFIEDLYE